MYICFNLCIIVLGLMLLRFWVQVRVKFFGVGNLVRVLAHA